MTQLTLIGCGRVIGRFARDVRVVMAAATTAQYLGVIDLEDRDPGGLAMTLLALSGGTYMFERYRRGFHQAGLSVARDTSAGRARKNARDVTAFAVHPPVGPVEGPAGGEMVKPGTAGRLSLRIPHGQRETADTRCKQQRNRSLSAYANNEFLVRTESLS